MTCYFAKASVRYLPRLLDVLMDMFMRATFPADEVARERGVIIEEIHMYEDQPQQVAQEALNALMWPRHPLGFSLSGTVANMEKMKRAHLVRHRDRYYHAGNLWICVAGKTSLEEVRGLLEPHLRQLRSGRPARASSANGSQSASRLRVVNKPIEQSHFALGLRGVSRHDPRRFAVRLLSVILGENMSSRLWQIVREKHGLAYSVGSSVTYFRDTGALSISAGVENNKLTKAVALTLRELRKMARKGPTDKELHQAKEYMLGQMHLSLESTTNQMMWMGENVIGYGRVIDPAKVALEIDRVTAREIRAVARDLVADHRLNLAVVSPKAKASDLIGLLTFK
jgi:predicted Zn-dependent peptidase